MRASDATRTSRSRRRRRVACGPRSANGADAVYLGVELLNARRGAENFTLD